MASGSDFFLPLFVSVLGGSRLRGAVSDCTFLRDLCPSDVKMGEGGYFITTFEAAINYLLR